MAKKQLPAKGRSSGKGGRYERIVVIGIIVALVAIVLTLWGPLRTFRTKEVMRSGQEAKKAELASKKQARPEAAEKKAEKKEKQARPGRQDVKEAGKWAETASSKGPEKRALVAIVIDDLGQDLKPARELASLPYKITFAVMPGLPQSRTVAELARQNSREVLLHLPMEYRGRNGKTSPGMLRSNMTPMDFLNTLTEDLGTVPGAVGVNNHEGSVLTENKEAMKFLMAELKARELLFLDSFTSPKSVAFDTAREFGLKTAKRDVFLDNESDNQESIRKQLDELAKVAREHGHAIGIGHPHPATINELRAWLGTATREGIEIVPVSKLMQ